MLDPDIDLRDEVGPETADELLDFADELGVTRGERDEDTLRDLLHELRFTSLLDGPPGWMPLLRPRELLGIRVESGAIRASAVDRRTVSGIHVEAAARQIHRLLGSVLGAGSDDEDEPVVPMELVLSLVTETPETFRRPLPPLGELIEQAGVGVLETPMVQVLR